MNEAKLNEFMGKLVTDMGDDGERHPRRRARFVLRDGRRRSHYARAACGANELDDGWLVKKKAAPVSDDDPIIQAIKKAIEQAGATS